jgi:hypothetical protein
LNDRPNLLAPLLMLLMVILTLGGLAWINYRVASQKKGGESFLAYRIGLRALLLDGKSPYSSDVADQVQKEIEQRGGGKLPSFRPTYPLYAGIFFLPFALVYDEVLARTLWMLALEIALFFFAYASVRLTRWRLDRMYLPLYALLVIFWFPSLISIYDGSLAVIYGLLLVFAFHAIQREVDELAGFLLALATMRPLLALLPLLFIAAWAIIHERWKLLFWFTGSLALLIFGGMFFLPGWLLQDIQASFAALPASYPMTPGAAFASWWPGAGSRLGWALTLAIGLFLAFEWWFAVGRKEYRWFLWTACLTLVLGQLIGIRTEVANQIILLLPLTLVFSVWDEHWRGTSHSFRGVLITALSVLILGVGLWIIYWNGAKQGYDARHMPVLLFPLPLFLWLTLYWVRWWAIRPPRLYVEALRVEEGN